MPSLAFTTPTVGAVRITYPASVIDDRTAEKTRGLILVGVISLIGAAFAAFLISSSFTSPIRRLQRTTERIAEGAIWFDFETLCEGPRSAADYIELGRLHHTVVLTGVPKLDGTRDDATRRFMTLVDEFYDRGVKLLIGAAAPPLDLYSGSKLRFEFARTQSRLQEMQSEEYLAEGHGPR